MSITADQTNGTVLEIPAGGGIADSLARGLTTHQAWQWMGAGDVFIVD